jgi:hypothetical protein
MALRTPRATPTPKWTLEGTAGAALRTLGGMNSLRAGVAMAAARVAAPARAARVPIPEMERKAAAELVVRVGPAAADLETEARAVMAELAAVGPEVTAPVAVLAVPVVEPAVAAVARAATVVPVVVTAVVVTAVVVTAVVETAAVETAVVVVTAARAAMVGPTVEGAAVMVEPAGERARAVETAVPMEVATVMAAAVETVVQATAEPQMSTGSAEIKSTVCFASGRTNHTFAQSVQSETANAARDL